MPRKQRFKPSRKPKPTPPNDDALNSRQTNSARPDLGNVESPPARDGDSMIEPALDHRSS